MDPALWELLTGDPDQELAVLIRLRDPAIPPPQVRVVAAFGPVCTGRVRRGDLLAVRAQENVLSVKAPRLYSSEPDVPEDADDDERPTDRRRPDVPQTGRGVVVGAIDWGCDFAHPAFRREDGGTRLLALWDQQSTAHGSPPPEYGYGVVHTTADINRALTEADPYAALGYDPEDSDPRKDGAHGTHVLSIAAGGGGGDTPVGLAPDADLVFVQLATPLGDQLVRLGDSVAVLEAIDFIARTAAGRPWVINMSLGRHAGAHDGSTLTERAMDWVVAAAPGRAIVQSAGNYFTRHTHQSGRLTTGGEYQLEWLVDETDVTRNEFDLWYPGADRFAVEVTTPDGMNTWRADLGQRVELTAGGRRYGNLHHRAHDPNNGDHQVTVFQYPAAPTGPWRVTLIGVAVSDGRFHAWVERDAACPGCQSTFPHDAADPHTTTGTICNGRRTIAVGAYDAHDPARPVARFSSAGPTRDGRMKPDLAAPGMRVLAARSGGGAVRKSGTSMAAPHVTGTVALMFEAAGRKLPIEDTRDLLFATANPAPHPPERVGHGYLNPAAAVTAATPVPVSPEPTMNPLPESVAEFAATPVPVPAPPCGCQVRPPVESVVPAAESVAPAWDESFTGVTSPVELDQLASQYLWQEDLMSETAYTPTAPVWSPPAETVVIPGVDAMAETLLDAQQPGGSNAAWLSDLLRAVSSFLPAIGQFIPTAQRLFDQAVRGGPTLGWDVVGRPGQRLTVGLQSGDLIVRRGEAGAAHACVVAYPTLVSAGAPGVQTEGPRPGVYVRVVEGGRRPRRAADGFARRIAGPDGVQLPDTLVLRSQVRPTEPPTESVPCPDGPSPRAMVRRGSVGASVGEAQRLLNRYHANQQMNGQPGLPDAPLVVDCQFGSRTEAAVRAFQRAAFPNQPAEYDGIVGSHTWAALDRLAGGLLPPLPLPVPPVPLPPFPPFPPPPPPEPPFPIIPVVAAAKLPVIIVPGIMGTRLEEPGNSGRIVWDPAPAPVSCRLATPTFSLNRLADPTPLAPREQHDIPDRFPCRTEFHDASTVPHFGNLVFGAYNRLAFSLGGPNVPVYACGYDWRQDNAVSALRLRTVVDEALRDTGAEKVVIVAHSMGGLVSRFYSRMLGGESKIAALILLGSPSHGAPLAYSSIKAGLPHLLPQFIRSVIQKLPGFVAQLPAIRFFRSLPSVFQLLPTRHYGRSNPDWLDFVPNPNPSGDTDGSNVTSVYNDSFTGFMDGLNGSPALNARVILALAARAFLDAALFDPTSGCYMHPNTFIFHSTGTATEDKFRLTRISGSVPFNLAVTHSGPGDETVPVFSGAASGCAPTATRTDFGGVKHGDLPNDPAVIRRIQSILAGLLAPAPTPIFTARNRGGAADPVFAGGAA